MAKYNPPIPRTEKVKNPERLIKMIKAAGGDVPESIQKAADDAAAARKAAEERAKG